MLGIHRATRKFAFRALSVLTIRLSALNSWRKDLSLLKLLFELFLATKSVAFILDEDNGKLMSYDVFLVAEPDWLQYIACHYFKTCASFLELDQLV